jgi:hypothetical protein
MYLQMDCDARIDQKHEWADAASFALTLPSCLSGRDKSNR